MGSLQNQLDKANQAGDVVGVSCVRCVTTCIPTSLLV